MKRLIVKMLGIIVARDYRLRGLGSRPDRWHWADRLLMHLGHYMGDDWKPRAGPPPEMPREAEFVGDALGVRFDIRDRWHFASKLAAARGVKGRS